ncbi:MAG: hypothetical protein QM704_01210 [Anaeromyxobacteraceae bacterium]
MSKWTIGAVLAVTSLAAPAAARATIFSDELGKCMVESTTQADRNAMVRWMFAAVAKHPAVKDVVSVSPEQLEAAYKGMADLMMRLLTKDCREKARAAFKADGPSAFQGSFQVLGQVAGREMFAAPEVAQSIAGLTRHLDEGQLKALVQETPAAK